MAIRISFAQASGSLEKVCDTVIEKHEIIIITRGDPRERDVAVIRATDLIALMETAHQLSLSRQAAEALALACAPRAA